MSPDRNLCLGYNEQYNSLLERLNYTPENTKYTLDHLMDIWRGNTKKIIFFYGPGVGWNPELFAYQLKQCFIPRFFGKIQDVREMDDWGKWNREDLVVGVVPWGISSKELNSSLDHLTRTAGWNDSKALRLLVAPKNLDELGIDSTKVIYNTFQVKMRVLGLETRDLRIRFKDYLNGPFRKILRNLDMVMSTLDGPGNELDIGISNSTLGVLVRGWIEEQVLVPEGEVKEIWEKYKNKSDFRLGLTLARKLRAMPMVYRGKKGVCIPADYRGLSKC